MVAQNMKNVKQILNTVNTLQQLIARRISIVAAMKTPWKRRVDAVRTLCTTYTPVTPILVLSMTEKFEPNGLERRENGVVVDATY